MNNSSYTCVAASDNVKDGDLKKHTCKEIIKLPEQDGGYQDSPTAPPLFRSCRLIVFVTSCLGFLILYTQRANLSVAIVCMVNQTAVLELKGNEINGSKSSARPRTCMGHQDNLTTKSTEDDTIDDGEFTWPKEVQGVLLGSFFWGLATTHVVGGWLAERYGGKRIIGCCALGSAIATLLMPVAARADYKALLVLRVFTGVCQGVVWPAMYVVWARWAPPLERQKLMSLAHSGSQIGSIVTFPVSAILCDTGFDGGWPSVFYILGLFGIAWFLAWSYLVYDSPEEHPRISESEKDYICSSLRKNLSMSLTKQRATPWKSLLTSTKVWAIIVTHMLSGWGIYTFLTNIPTYMSDVLYLDHQKNGLNSALPYIGMLLIINISGAIYDAFISRKCCSHTAARKICNSIGFLVPGLSIIGLGYMDCAHMVMAVTLLVICVSMCGFQIGAGFMTNNVEIAPQYAGVIFGLSSTFATLSGIAAPTLIGYITTDQLQSQWQTVFFITGGLYTLGALIFVIFGSGEIQEWAYVWNDETITVKSLSVSTLQKT